MLWRKTPQTTARAWRDLPLLSDPVVAEFLRRPLNITFTIVAVIMFAIAWPTLPATHSIMPALLPVAAAPAAFPIMLAWANPSLGWGISLISAALIGIVADRAHGWPWDVQVVHIIEMVVLSAMVCLRGPIRWLPLYWACTCAVFALVAPPGARGGWVVGLSVLFMVVGLLRGLVRSRRDLAVETELKDAAASRTAVLAEGARIARDLHDVVAHRMSVVVVAAQTARFRVDGVTPAADVEFQAIAGMAREALDEVRQMLGVLRVDGEVVHAPNPGINDIEGLIVSTRTAGLVVDYRLVGAAPETVPEGAALTAYRIVQECLANAARHAAGARIDVEVVVDDTTVRVAAVNPLVATVTPSTDIAGGHGIPGMIARARAVGGDLVAGPDGAGSFRVAAVLPMRLHVTSVGG